MKRIARYSLVLVAGIFGVISLLIPLSAKQIGKNRLVLADMKERVQAIRDFQRQHARLPSEEELSQLSCSLPVRYTLYDYRIDTTPGGSGTGYPTHWPSTGGWVLWFWRGEWSEYYSSWDEHYSLSDQASWWGFCGPLLFTPLVSAALIVVSRQRFLKEAKAQQVVVHQPAESPHQQT